MGVARGDAVLRLGDQRAVAVILVAGVACAEDAIERIIGVALTAVIEEVACGIIAPAHDLVGGVIAQVLRRVLLCAIVSSFSSNPSRPSQIYAHKLASQYCCNSIHC